MKKFFASILILIFLCTQACFAQTEDKTKEIIVRVTEKVTSESITTADTISAELVTDFKLKNGAYFKKGTIVSLLPKEIKKRGFAGKGGYIEIRKGIIRDVTGKEYTVSLRQKVQGDDRDWIVACMVVFTATIILIPFNLIALIKGKSAILEEGTTIECTIEDL